jgi:hypothetical protein
MKSIEMDSHGLLGVGRGVYKPLFLVVGLEMTQEVKELIYLMICNAILTNRNDYVVLT